MTFDQPVVASSSPATTVGITSSTAATGMTAAAPVFSGNTVSVNLSGLKNQAAYTVTVNNIVSQADATGVLASASASFRTLLGDVNAIGQVGIADLVTVKFTAGQITNGANFRADLNGGGTIVIGDVTIVKFNSPKQAAPTGTWADTAPNHHNGRRPECHERRRDGPHRIHRRGQPNPMRACCTSGPPPTIPRCCPLGTLSWPAQALRAPSVSCPPRVRSVAAWSP